MKLKQRLKNLLRKKEKPVDLLRQIYKDKNGNIYYQFRDHSRIMPAHRFRLAEMALIEVDCCISAKDGARLVDAAINKFEEWTKSAKSTGLADCLSILVELKRRFVSLLEEETLLKLATIYFTMNDEDPEHYIESEQQAKRNAWDLDAKAKDFFLCRAAEITMFFGDTSDKDILMYLKKNQPELKKADLFLKKSGLSST